MNATFGICPAYAGMIPGGYLKVLDKSDLSRVCGDDPALGITMNY